MAKAKTYKVGFKTINEKLKVTKRHLSRIKKNVSPKDQRTIAAQIKAIDVLLSACVGKMSAVYKGPGN